MRSLLRIVIAASFVCFLASARPAAACDYEVTIRYYNAQQQPVGFEIYFCNGSHVTHGTLNGQWIEEIDKDCCTGQEQHGYFYLCPDGVYHTVTAIGDTNCS